MKRRVELELNKGSLTGGLKADISAEVMYITGRPRSAGLLRGCQEETQLTLDIKINLDS